MRNTVLVIGSFVIILVMCGVCDAKRTEGGHRTRAGRGMNDRVNGSKPHRHRHHHAKRLEEECQEYVKNLRKRGTYYVPAGEYVPSRCYQAYCTCAVSSCRRRCPYDYQRPGSIYQGKDWYGPKYGCRCNPRGSEITSCDIVTGQCRCKPNYTGLQCDTCLPGFWDSPSEGCTRCSCDPTGSTDTNCNKHGQCHCKPGVGGLRCDICIDKFYGFSQSGCKPCQPCNEAGHICDPDSGACVCPPLREGHSCQNCVKNTWLLRNNTCMACGCSETGSVKTQCNVKTGQCSCKQGYTGDKCDRCSHGYYGYPTCKRCNCNPMGTDRGYCDSEGICQCRQDGYCPCKSNVVGRRCNTCKEGTFGLDMENSDGCTKCFCFGRSSKCDEAGLTWEKELASDRTLTISHNSAHQGLTSNDVNPLVEIPSHPTDITLYSPAEAPLYWVLPFKGDLVSSYGGYLRFKASTSDHNSPQQFPRVQIQGKETTIESYTLRHDEIKLHESQWTERNRPITREQLMVVLQSVQKILVKATETVQFTNVSLSNVSLDVGRYFKGRPPPRALSVEKCECPKEYEGTSCQDPNVGYFRYFGPPHDPEFSWIDRVVGTAKPCECNGLSSVCERETGHCLNCSDNRAGRHCESCAESFYMDDRSFCLPCGCPYETLNFAKSCKIRDGGSFSCFCKKGYEGERCEICSRGYYGNPLQENGSCEPCNCNLVGSISNDCDFHTGNCLCKPGFTGKYCSQCEAYRHVIQNQRCLPCDDCTQMLLNELDIISYDLNNSTLHLQGGIKPPWEKLAGYQRRYENLKNRFGNYEDKKDEAYDLIQSGNLNLLSDRVQSLKERLNGKENEVNEIANRANNLSGSSANLLGEINGIKTKLNNINTMLNKFGTTHETTKSALRKGRNWLKEIKEIQSQFKSKDEYDAILGSCNKILTQVTYLNESVTKPDGIKHRLDDLKNRIDDLGTLLTEIEKLQNTVNQTNFENERRILNLTEQLAPYQNIGTITSGLEGAETLKEQIQQLIDSTQNNYDALRNNNTIKMLLEELGKRESNLKEKNPLLEDYLLKVKQHVKQLEENASKYNRILDIGNAEWKKSINAYDDLIRNIKEAEEAALTAREELEKAYSIMHPIGGDSISDKASLSYADSTRMLARIQNNQDMPDIRGIPIAIATANLDLQSNGKMNNDQTAKIRHMANNIKIVDLYGVIQKAIDQSAQMQKVYQKVLDINYKKHHELGRDYHKYLNLTSMDELNGLTKKINFAREKLHYIIEQNSTYFQHIKDINGKFHNDNSRFKSISDRMDELKAKIQRARQTADSIKVSLAGQTCHMKYLLEEMEPTVHFNISVRITMAKQNVAWKEKKYSLFHVENQKGSQISLEVFNHSVTFTWRFKDTQKNLVVTADDINNVTEINVERVTNGITLSVTNETGDKKSQWLNETASVLYLTRKDLVEVGRNTGLPGCIRDILWNGGRIGFWAFKEKQGDCRGCERIADEQTSQNFFDGTGYAQIKNKLKRKDNLGIIFEINTLDENALILLIPENRSLNNKSECTSFIALSLNDGRIQAEIHYQNKDPLILLTDKRYNTGTTKKVQFTRESSRGADLIKVDDNKASTSQFSPMKSNDISFYLGGVPTEYLLDPDVNSCRPQHTAEGLVGTLNSIQMTPALVGTINLSQGTSVGVSLAINKVVYRRVWFSGKGYLILKSKPEKLNSLKFVIRTQMSSGFILSIEGLLHVYLENKTLHVKGTDGIPHAVSYKDISDGDYHFVEIVNGENLTVDEEAGSLVEFNGDKKRIIIGSSPDIPGNFTGGLKDITVNNRVVEFTNDTIEEFRGAKIGRKWEELPEKVVTGTAHIDKDVNTLNEMKDSQDTGCQRVDIVPERNAAKFGDTLNEASFTLHMLKSSLWKSNYVIEFDLRTFYPDGLIFLIKNPKKLNYYLLKIREGILLLQIKIGKNTTTLKMERKINDGIWHHVTIKYDKKNKEIQMSIDRTRMKSTIIKKNKKNFRELYIGGLPDTSKDLKRLNEDLEIHQFRGCINNLKINSENKSIVGNETKHNKIGQCFASIESGSYFPGDAYAVYSNHFTVNKILELNFEFKTSELNGILLSMSGEGDKPALSLELQNGAIVMTIDSGQGPVSNVTNDLSKHPLCNNGWHNVTALYINSELTVNVDGISKTWVVQEEAGVEMTAPLYIGGLPDDAPTGTLKIKENFKGCMRNIKIGVEPKDWTDMDELNNVLLNSCPAAA